MRPIFPEEFTMESLQILMKNKIVWNAQYANNPREGGALFQPEWKRFFYWVDPRTILFDTGIDKIQRNVQELDRVIMIDPAMNGPAGFVVTGMDKQNRIAILEATKKSWKPPELVDYLFNAVTKWQPRIVAIEEVLFSGLFQHWLQTEMSVRGIRFKVVPVKTRQKAKDARVLGLSNYYQAGQIFMNETQTDFLQEYDEFGATDNYHMHDALAYGPELWRAPVMSDMRDKIDRAMEILQESRDNLTGYSSY
jgi:predicted phage terminase large subunit-like protein